MLGYCGKRGAFYVRRSARVHSTKTAAQVSEAERNGQRVTFWFWPRPRSPMTTTSAQFLLLRCCGALLSLPRRGERSTGEALSPRLSATATVAAAVYFIIISRDIIIISWHWMLVIYCPDTQLRDVVASLSVGSIRRRLRHHRSNLLSRCRPFEPSLHFVSIVRWRINFIGRGCSYNKRSVDP